MRINLDGLSALLLALVILSTANPWYSHYLMIEGLLVCLLVTSGSIFFAKKKTFLSKKLLLLVSLFSIVFFLQWAIYGLFPLVTIAGFFVRLLCAYFIVNICKDFPLTFVKVIFVLSSISLLIWFLEVFTPLSVLVEAFPQVYQHEESMWPRSLSPLYTSLTENLDSVVKRNAGFVWEPGAFAGINIMAIIFCLLSFKNLSVKKRARYLVVFIMSVLSSQSTAAFLTLPIVLYLVYRRYVSKNRLSFREISTSLLFAFTILLPICVYLSNLPFVTDKIEQQLQFAMIDSVGSGLNNSRFGSMLFDLTYIYESPLIGNGLNDITRFRFHDIDDLSAGHGNGLTDFIADFGLIVFAVMVWLIYQGISSYNRGDKISPVLWTLVILMLLFSETYFNHPFFWCFVFLLGDTQRQSRY
jgi:hypothetical protein